MPAESTKLVHQAFLYGSPDEFVAGMAPFVREGLRRGDTVFAAAKGPNIEALREELGSDAERVDLNDTAAWQTRPYERLQAFKRLVAELPERGVLRAMGEPVWEGSDAAVRQWARYESIINAALADAPMRFICLYDAGALPDHILDYACRTHPSRIDGQAERECGDFVPPVEFVAGRPAAPPEGAPELPLAGHQFRELVAEHARAAGLAPRRVDEFVMAANEIATNALKYGAPPLRARVWADGGEVICQVTDRGPGISDPLAGWVPPAGPGIGGWGLPIARQLADAVEIVPSEGGTIVSLHVSV